MQINPRHSIQNSIGLNHRALVKPTHPHKHAGGPQAASSNQPASTSASAEKPAHKKPAPSVSDTSAGSSNVTVVECGPFQQPPSAAQSTEASLTLDGLYAAWGQTKSPYDLTGNGMVDVDDLLAFINGLPAEAGPVAAASPANSIMVGESENAIFIADPPASNQGPANEIWIAEESSANSDPLTLDGFTKTWGQANEQYDLNNDGTVDVDDLMTFINGLPNESSPDEPQAAIAPELSDKHKGSALTLAQSTINSLADTLIDKLIGAGFEDQPPTNMRELVNKLQLSPRDTTQMFKRLGSQYPRGLGVNMVG
jgi:hypothetical protein